MEYYEKIFSSQLKGLPFQVTFKKLKVQSLIALVPSYFFATNVV